MSPSSVGKWALVIGLSLAAAQMRADELADPQTVFDGTDLNGVDSVAVRDNFFYAASAIDGKISVFARDAASGALSASTVYPLPGATSVVVSPDGANVYATGNTLNEVRSYARDLLTGNLTQIDADDDTDPGVDGLEGAASVVVSPDGKNVYVAGPADNAVAMFQRQAGGALQFVALVRDSAGTPTVDGLAGVRSITLDPDGKNLYAAGTLDDAIAVFDRNPTTGFLTFRQVMRDGDGGMVDGLGGVRALIVSADKQIVYAASDDDPSDADTDDDNAVVVLSRDTTTGQLSFPGTILREGSGGVVGLDGARALAFSGGYLYVASDAAGAVCAFARSGTNLSFLTHYSAADGYAALAGAASIATGGGDTRLYVAAAQAGGISVFARGPAHELLLVEEEFGGASGVDGLAQAAGVAVSPDDANVYAVGTADNAVAVFVTSDGPPTFLQVKRQGVGVDGLTGVSGVAVSPDGGHVYTAATTDDAVATFARRPGGRLIWVEAVRDGVGGVDGLDGARAVAISPDGNHLYAAGSIDRAVAAFARNASTGQLTFLGLQRDGIAGVDGLDGAWALSVSPSGDHLYVAGRNDDAVAVFARDTGSGALTFVEAQRDGVGGVDGLNDASAVAVSPDGGHVYAAGNSDNAVAIFARALDTGRLTFRGIRKDGLSGVTGLLGVEALAVSPLGDHLYSAASDADAVDLFTGAETGALNFVQARADSGLRGARAIAASPSGLRVYAAARRDDALTAYRVVRCGDAVREGSEPCDDGNLVDTDDCLSACTLAACGDQALHSSGTAPFEDCDDGGRIDGDGCDANCRTEMCGNGVTQPGNAEQCDDGNIADTDDCLSSCRSATCGDGQLHGSGTPPFEACDDHNLVDGDGCDNNCTVTACGNGVVSSGEECDPPGTFCDASCQVIPGCGNGLTETGLCVAGRVRANCATDAACDSTLASNDGHCGARLCDAGTLGTACTTDTDCDTAAGIDDGHCPTAACDAGRIGSTCSTDAACDTIAASGDGRCATEQCDAGATDADGDGIVNDDRGDCTTACRTSRCGDGLEHRQGTGPFEQCDRGDAQNGVAGSGCSAQCKDVREASCQRRLGGWSFSAPAATGARKRTLVCEDPGCRDTADPTQCAFTVQFCLALGVANARCNPHAIAAVDFRRLDVGKAFQREAALRLSSAVEALAPGTADIPGRCAEGLAGKQCHVDRDCDRQLGKGDGRCDIGTGVNFAPPVTAAQLAQTLCTSPVTLRVPAGESLRLRARTWGQVNDGGVINPLLRSDKDNLHLVCRGPSAD